METDKATVDGYEAIVKPARGMPPPDYKKPEAGAKCQECALGMPFYVPCGKPAEYIITNRGETYPMCFPCANHNTKNRGASYVTEDLSATRTILETKL